jgi:hypothetical protein
VSGHADTIRRQLDEDNGVRILVHRLLLEDVLAENQRLRDALEQIGNATKGTNPVLVGVSVTQIAGFARNALAAVVEE